MIIHPLDDPEWHIYYAVRTGIRYTGMPAWNKALSDQDMWKVTAFLSRIEKLPLPVQDYWKKSTGVAPPPLTPKGKRTGTTIRDLWQQPEIGSIYIIRVCARLEWSAWKGIMPTDIVMPQMGESIFEGTITKWLKKPGDKVQRDEPLFEISTDKVDAEIPAPASGVLQDIKVAEGATVQVNTVVGTISDGDGLLPPSPPPRAAPAKKEAAPAPAPAPAPEPKAAAPGFTTSA